MFNKNQNLLLVDFDSIRGMLLKWNLIGNAYGNFFRHVLIFDVDQKFDFKQFGNCYFEHIKLGDIITFSCITEDDEFFFLKWKEKSPITTLKLQRLRPSTLSSKYIEKILEKIDERTKQFNEPIVYIIITQKKSKDLISLWQSIKIWMQRENKFLFNIFCERQNSIELTTGINFFKLNQFQKIQNKEFWNFYRLYLSQISFLKIKITLQCENGYFASKKEEEWKNIDFNRITRIIYAPSCNYVEDTIQFLNEDSSPEVNYSLNIILEFTRLDNLSYTASKKILISTINEKAYQRTCQGKQLRFSTQMFPGFYSKRNPFKSQSLVWFKKDSHF